MRKKRMLSIVSFVMSLTLIFTFWGCGTDVKAEDLMSGITASNVEGRESNDEFLLSQLNFAVELLRQNKGATANTVLSPMSIAQCLAMLANGAEGETLRQIEAALGGNLTIDELNEFYYTFIKNLTSDGTLSTANSVWFKDTFDIKEGFLQKNADYYSADAYASPFDEKTVADINTWVNEKTDGNIPSIIDSLPSDAVSVLINAILFAAEWEVPYEDSSVYDGKFTTADGKEQNAEFMRSFDELYLTDGETFEGIIKYYKGKKYAFAAIMPQSRKISEVVDFNTFVTEQLSGESLKNAMQNIEYTVNTHLPKFNIEHSLSQNAVLQNMGITDVFNEDKANLSGISDTPTCLSSVIHKAVITVDEKGTVAAAVTGAITDTVGISTPPRYLKFDSPFVYMIIDTSSFLPIFIGSVNSMN